MVVSIYDQCLFDNDVVSQTQVALEVQLDLTVAYNHMEIGRAWAHGDEVAALNRL